MKTFLVCLTAVLVALICFGHATVAVAILAAFVVALLCAGVGYAAGSERVTALPHACTHSDGPTTLTVTGFQGESTLTIPPDYAPISREMH